MRAWEKFLDWLEEPFGKDTVDKWLRTLRIQRFDACNLYLEPTDSFQAMWIEEHILPLAKKHFLNNNGHQIHLHVQVAEKRGKSDVTPAESIIPYLKFESDTLYPHCTFDQYIPAKNNEMSVSILQKLVGFDSQNDNTQQLKLEKLNPIYLYGPEGTGKTHLLMATATHLTQQGFNVFFAKAETFTQHVVNAIRSSKMQSFRQAYRTADVLIIDDVEVFARKAATQEEFFHTFNALHTAGKQIILSAKCNPRLLELLEERLISRFEWGITLPLEKEFDSQTLHKILQRRSQLYHASMNSRLTEYLLKSFASPAALSRALECLQSHMQTSLQHLELAHVEPILSKLADQEKSRIIGPEQILDAVATVFGIQKEDMTSKSQTRDAVLPRKIAMYLLRKELKLPYMKIGDLFGRDHSTVMSSIKHIQQGLEQNQPQVAYYLNQLRRIR